MKLRNLFSILTIVMVLAGCAAPMPSQSSFTSAEQAISLAKGAGAEEHAPVEMRFAREKLAEARYGMEVRDFRAATLLIEQAEINAELALARTQAALQRKKVNDLQSTNEILLEELQQTFGEDFQP